MTPLNRYTCEEAFRRLDDYLDRELSSEETVLVHEHLEICAGCAREFNFEASVLKGVREKLRQIEVPESLQARILSVLDKHR
jgi:anti-sigma factor (TIGR02949 family)